MTAPDCHRAADLLLTMEMEMRRIGLWEAEAPPPAALASTLPFCYDTLRFEQWLQWIFLPRMRGIVERDSGWPQRCDIFPLAQHSFEPLACDTKRLLESIQAFDEIIGRSAT